MEWSMGESFLGGGETGVLRATVGALPQPSTKTRNTHAHVTEAYNRLRVKILFLLMEFMELRYRRSIFYRTLYQNFVEMKYYFRAVGFRFQNFKDLGIKGFMNFQSLSKPGWNPCPSRRNAYQQFDDHRKSDKRTQ